MKEQTNVWRCTCNQIMRIYHGEVIMEGYQWIRRKMWFKILGKATREVGVSINQPPVFFPIEV